MCPSKLQKVKSSIINTYYMKRVVIITDEGFEDEEVLYPVIRLFEAGIEVSIAVKDKKMPRGRRGYPLETLYKYYAKALDTSDLRADDFDCVIIPGGFEAPDRVRQQPVVLEFIKAMVRQNKIVAALCHGPWVLISAGVVKNKKITGYRGIIDDIRNAGAEYVDDAVVIDGSIITSRHPKDLGVFMMSIMQRLAD